jgi:hypothetical protein
MSYLRDNRRNNYQDNYFRNNSEKKFSRRNFSNYDKIYNKFLISPYPPMYYQRSTIDLDNYYNIYNNNNNNIYDKESPEFNNEDSNRNNNTNNNRNNNNYLQYRQIQTTNDLNSLERERRNNSYNTPEYKNMNKNENNFIKDDSLFEDEIRRKQYSERNRNEEVKIIDNNNNYHYNKEQVSNDNVKMNNINKYDNYQLTEDVNNRYEYIMKKPNEPKEVNERNNNNNNNDNANFNSLDNNNLYQSYNNNVSVRKINRGYISPIITKIAKKNFLGENPYTDKEQNLGPSMLKNNPILYPIDTYKFDFNRYIKGDFVNKFV